MRIKTLTNSNSDVSKARLNAGSSEIRIFKKRVAIDCLEAITIDFCFGRKRDLTVRRSIKPDAT